MIKYENIQKYVFTREKICDIMKTQENKER